MAQQNGIGSPGIYLAFAAYLTFVNSLLEEYVWRWFVFEQCAVLMPNKAAVPAAALFFTLHHVLALRLQFGWLITLLGSLGVLTGGALWSGLYLRYHSIWPGYLSHVCIDLVILTIGWWLTQSGPRPPAPAAAG
jgi:membrane protease YdiL (CAAX protease family)